jgi:hypothetical protein
MHDHRHRPPLRLVTGAEGPQAEQRSPERDVSQRLRLVAPGRKRRRVDWYGIGVFVLMLTSVGASVEALRSATVPTPPRTAAAPDEMTWVAQTIRTPAPKIAPRPPAPREEGGNG